MATTTGEGLDREPSAASTTGAPKAAELGHRKLSGSISHLPSPMLTPRDPRPELATEGQLAHERATTSPTRGVPTPEPSEESQSDVEHPTDSFSHEAKGHESKPESSNQTTVAVAKTRSRSNTKTSNPGGVRRLSASKMQELTAAPESLPIASMPERKLADQPLSASIAETISRSAMAERQEFPRVDGSDARQEGGNTRPTFQTRPDIGGRTLSTPPMSRRKSTSQPPAQSSSSNRRNSFQPPPRPAPLDLEGRGNHGSGTSKQPAPRRGDGVDDIPPSPVPPSIPLPPMSVPTLLQLELAGQRPSPLYIHHSYTTDIPYESSAVKFERLKNVMMLPWFLERTIIFGALACLDAWLWTFTILPMRFCISLSVLVQWWCHVLQKEARWLVGFVWYGLGRMWKRGRRGRSTSKTNHHDLGQTDESRSRSRARDVGDRVGGQSSGVSVAAGELASRRRETSRTHSSSSVPLSKRPGNRPPGGTFRHRRTKSSPSNLTSYNKADLLQGAIIICSSVALMNLDASRMYHFIRAQSAIKLYAIYNLLEVGDRLMSALGQDILECLFSAETLSRNSSGRSKVMLPLGMFLGALVYNILHSVILFYQVIALNVAVNSYSNALMTLLLSNQFVEIKSTVFKRFEKENTFQLACADIVERFQLWIMLVIIAMRNIVEVGGFWVPGAGGEEGGPSSFPLHTSSILPASFTIMPSWLWSGEVLSPFFVVIGSEMVVDWIKHAFVNKFNNIKPTFYSRILDILCKDYYTNAFVTPSLTRRLGLPVMPLSCLFIRASVQIYNMFLATHLPTPLPPSAHTALSVDSAAPSPAMVAALDRLDNLIRNALGRAVYGSPYPDLLVSPDNGTAEQAADTAAGAGMGTKLWMKWQFTSDDVIAGLTMVVVFLLVFLLLLIVKMLLGMVLLRYSRDRYAKMKMKEHAIAVGRQERESFDAKGRRVGGYGNVEVGDDRRRWIFADDPEGLRKVQERDKRNRDKEEREKEKDFGGVVRYEMVARRIW
ncbi:putative eukaryotic membrane protein [Triangularia setosa]|uniref:Eukaryotic membrane protein n=1 Tax=Triangularia setosa TaxID=2587417 RepID=A0AAN7A3F9_9PEZI|nr:putative eukaryotic membrane protein [Podospora setosa]